MTIESSGRTGPSAPPELRVSGLRRADLSDPDKQEAALTKYFADLIVSEPLGSTLTPASIEYLAGWMARDPLMKEQALSYLERILE